MGRPEGARISRDTSQRRFWIQETRKRERRAAEAEDFVAGNFGLRLTSHGSITEGFAVGFIWKSEAGRRKRHGGNKKWTKDKSQREEKREEAIIT